MLFRSPNIKTWIKIGGKESPDIDNFFLYENIILSNEPMERIKRDEDNIYMIYTGGTTGMPKGVMYTHGSFVISMFGGLKMQGYEVPDVRKKENILQLKEVIQKRSHENNSTRCLIACPLMHGTGMFLGGFMTHCLGGSIITIPEIGLNPSKLLKEIELNKVKKRGGRIFFLGVGGSAGNCSHAVNDFRKLCNIECYTPTDNVSELTARINDEGWASSFVNWLKVSKFKKKDALFILSVGGGNKKKNISTNLVMDIDYAKKINANIFGQIRLHRNH